MKTYKVLCVVTLLLLAGTASCLAVTQKDDDVWHRVQSSGVVIEFQAGLGPLARQIMPEAIRLAQCGPQAQSERAVAKFVPKKNEILRFIASELDLAERSQLSKERFDVMVKYPSLVAGPRHIRLWHRQALKQAVISGEGAPCVMYDPATDVFRTYFHAKILPDGTMVPPAPLSVPIDLTKSKSPLDQALEYINSQLSKIDPVWDTHAFFHEITEGMIISGTSLHGCFRRWLCDGVADYLGERCLGKFVGKSTLDKYLAQQEARMQELIRLRGQVDLVGWRAVEWEEQLPYQMSGELSYAHYVFAAHEIRELAKRCGPRTLPKVFEEIRKSHVEGSYGLLDAVSRATGEDFRARLSTYGAENSEELRGLGLFEFQAISYSVNDEKPITDGCEIPIIADDKHGILAVVFCESLQYPLEVKWEISGASSAKWVGRTERQPEYNSESKDTPMVQYAMLEPFSTGRLKAGNNTLSLYLQGKLVRQLKFRLVNTSE